MGIFGDFYLKVKLLSNKAVVPNNGTEFGNAGYDIYSSQDYVIHSNEEKLISTGWCCEFTPGFVMVIKEKSGRRWKDKLQVGAGVIDSNYRDEVKVVLKNIGDKPVRIKAKEKVAQFIILPIWGGKVEEVSELDMSEDRGGGFGKTGLK